MLVAGSNMQDINVLKRKLAKSFAMKDLGATKQILGMRITRDRKNRKLTLSQGEYIEKVLQRFRMQNAIRENLESKMGLIIKCANNKFVSWNSRTNRISIK